MLLLLFSKRKSMLAFGEQLNSSSVVSLHSNFSFEKEGQGLQGLANVGCINGFTCCREVFVNVWMIKTNSCEAVSRFIATKRWIVELVK
jgi:hypothetical protein